METNHGGKSVTVFKNGQPTDFKPKIPKAPALPKIKDQPVLKPEPVKKDMVTKKARDVTRVANRLGRVDTDDPDETMELLTVEAQKMKENVYKYLDSLAQLWKNFCYETDPKCIKCPMNEECQYRKSQMKTKRFFKR